ncbi:MAG: hypothetical protein DSY53_03255 [Persephonella sp.]|nr:MAG: hypothetical protein DSY53_03255 [Persephonella sp.]
MPSGDTHELINIVALPVALTIIQPYGFIPFIAGYLFSTYYLSPDLDLPQSKATQRWGRLRFIWKPYQSFIPHRNFISHFPIISSILRLIYVIIPILLVTYLTLIIIDEVFQTELLKFVMEGVADYELEMILKKNLTDFVLGVIVADTIHIVFDFSITFLKKTRTKINKKLKFIKI